MKRICILRSNPVNPDSRVEKEADAMAEAGYEVDIFCWDRASNHRIVNTSIHDGKIKVYRKGVKAEFGAGLKSLPAFLRFQFSMMAWILKNGKKYDAFHACDFDTAFFSYIPIRIKRKKVVFDVFDFICGDPQNFLQRIVKKAQYVLINKSDATIICTEQRMQQIIGSSPKKLAIIHNSPDSQMISDECPIEVDSERVSVVYVGILQEHRLLREMLSFFEKNKEYDLYIAGFGKLENLCREMDAKNNNIHFLGKISYSKTIALEKECDIMTAIYDPIIENHRFAASNKFYESLMLGKPVIMVKNTGMSEEVQEASIGALIDYSEEGFSRGLEELVSRKDEWEFISKKMQYLYMNKFNWNVMKKRLVDLYSEILK